MYLIWAGCILTFEQWFQSTCAPNVKFCWSALNISKFHLIDFSGVTLTAAIMTELNEPHSPIPAGLSIMNDICKAIKIGVRKKLFECYFIYGRVSQVSHYQLFLSILLTHEVPPGIWPSSHQLEQLPNDLHAEKVANICFFENKIAQKWLKTKPDLPVWGTFKHFPSLLSLRTGMGAGRWL